MPPGRNIADYSDAGETLDAALSPWRLALGHPNFQGPADATVLGTRQAFDPDTYESVADGQGEIRSVQQLSGQPQHPTDAGCLRTLREMIATVTATRLGSRGGCNTS